MKNLSKVTAITLLLLISKASIASEMLDGKALKALMLKGPWETVTHVIGRRATWTWEEDNVACLKPGLLGDGTECAYEGTWTLSDNVLCYEVNWSSESVAKNNNGCITVQQVGPNLYSRYTHGDVFVSKLYDFKVIIPPNNHNSKSTCRFDDDLS